MTTYVATFYSFKGGVGRTTLLVNAAHVLADRGERVLVWDLDLEAPGVHQFPGLGPPEPLWQGGFLEWLGDTPPCPTPDPTSAWPSESWLNALGDRVYAVHGEHRGTIFVLPALGTLANLGDRYAAVDWNALFVQRPEHGLHLLSRARDALIARFEPTFLFIDSRTGVSDLGGFLTRYLPDCTVLIGNYGVQSTEGLRSVYLALDRFATERVQSEPHRHRKLDRLLVASPVPVSPVARERGRERWASGFPGVAPRTLVEVPLVESLLYAEDVLVRTAPSSDAARAYQAVANQLIELRASYARSEPLVRAPGDEPSKIANVERLLRLLGFETTMPEGPEFVARERTLLGERTYLVTYLAGTARATPALREVLERLRGQLGSAQGIPLLIVDAARDDARRAAEAAGISLRTAGELEDQLVDLRAYVASLRRNFEDSELARTYIATRVVTHGQTGDALALAMSWAIGNGPQLLVLVGDAGSGKTGFVRRLAYELATQVDVDPATPIPVLIDLLHAASTSTLASLLQEHLQRAIGWHGNPEAILHLYRAGRIVLLCDGLEDLPAPRAIGDRLRWLTQSTTSPGDTATAHRMLVTVRANTLDDAGIASETLDAQIATLAPFDVSQIGTYLTNRLGFAVASETFDDILRTPGLAQLASRPMLLDLIADGLGSIGPSEHATTAMLYDRYVRRWIERDAPGSVLQPAQRARMIERMAAELWQRRTSRLTGASLLAILHEAVPSELSVSQLALELREAPFLVRSEDDSYGFSRRAFLEYFVARHLARCARANADTLREALATDRLTPSCVALLTELMADAPEAQSKIQAIATGPYLPEASENALQIAAALRAQPAALSRAGAR